jgi:hypothetical protein
LEAKVIFPPLTVSFVFDTTQHNNTIIIIIIITPFANYFYIIKVIGYSMEDKQQQQQQQDKSGAGGGVRRSSRLVESPLTKETRINTNKNKSPFVNRRLLPTQRLHSSPVERKRSASVVLFADSVIMPPKKKTKTATTTKTRTNWKSRKMCFFVSRSSMFLRTLLLVLVKSQRNSGLEFTRCSKSLLRNVPVN